MQATRERIVDAASSLFMARGLAGSGLKQISEASGAPIGSLYHFFPGGKAELASETLRASGRAYEALVTAIFDTAPDLLTGVQWCFDAAAARLRDTDYADACPIATVALEVASSDEDLRAVTDEIFSSWLEALRVRLVAGGVSTGRAAEVAAVLLAALEGGFLLCRVAKDTAAMAAIGSAMVTLVGSAIDQID